MNYSLIIIFAFAICFFYLPKAFADARANINHAGQIYKSLKGDATGTLKFEKGPGEVAIQTRKRKYIIPLDLFHLKNGDLIISEDGETVVWVLKSHFVGMNVKHESDAMMIFKSGKLVSKISLKEFVSLMTRLPTTVSHTIWVLDLVVEFDKNRIELTTTEYKIFQINLVDGVVKDQGYIEAYNEAEYIVNGGFVQQSDVEKFSGEIAKLKIYDWVKGNGRAEYVEITGLESSGAPFGNSLYILRKEGSAWKLVGRFYDNIKNKMPPTQMKYMATFLPRVSVDGFSLGLLKFKKEKKGDQGLVVFQMPSIKDQVYAVIVIPQVDWASTKKMKINKIYTWESIDQKWKEISTPVHISLDHRIKPMKMDFFDLVLPSPGKSFTTFEEKNLFLKENPIQLSSTSSPEEIKSFFGRFSVKNIEITPF